MSRHEESTITQTGAPASTALPLLLDGAPRARGQVHGESLRSLIIQHVERLRVWVATATGGAPDDTLRPLLESTGLVAAAQRHTPDLFEEVTGIAEGAGLPLEQLLPLQLLDEVWWYIEDRRSTRLDAHHCTGLGYSPSRGRPLVAQNMDLPDFFSGLETLLHVVEDQGSALLLSAAGMLVLNGLNDRGVGVCVNTLMQLDHSPDGLPVAFMIRRLLQMPSMAAAVDQLVRLPHASGQNYIVGAADGVADIECSAGAAVRHDPPNGGELVWHTNHALSNADEGQSSERRRRIVASGATPPSGGNSEERYDFMTRALDAGPELTVELVQSLLASDEVPICVPNRRSGATMTLATVVAECGPNPVFHAAWAPPAPGNYRVFSFDPSAGTKTT